MTTAAPIRFGDLELVPDPDMPEGAIAYRHADGTRLCAGCGCREDNHCRVCGCRTRAGEPEECLCARFVAVIWVCVDCGHMFGDRWRMQNHRMPSPTCLRGARAAAGRYADKPDRLPPLTAHRDKYVRGT